MLFFSFNSVQFQSLWSYFFKHCEQTFHSHLVKFPDWYWKRNIGPRFQDLKRKEFQLLNAVSHSFKVCFKVHITKSYPSLSMVNRSHWMLPIGINTCDKIIWTFKRCLLRKKNNETPNLGIDFEICTLYFKIIYLIRISRQKFAKL